MATKLKDLLVKSQKQNQDGYTPKPGDEKKFAALHVVKNTKLTDNPDENFRGDTTTFDREKNRMGYNRGSDKDAYFAPGGISDKGVGEEVEVIDELGHKTITSYFNKSIDNQFKLGKKDNRKLERRKP